MKYESSSASPLENKKHPDKLEVIEMFEKNLNNSLSDEDLIDFEKLTDGFFLFSEQEKAFLYQYATKHLNVRYNKWEEIDTSDDSEIEFNDQYIVVQ